MRCPYCSFAESKVIDSRPTDEGNSIRRRRECLSCQKRFTTYETVETVPLVIIKKDGSRQPYYREKMLGGMVKACEKRPVSLGELEKIADEIEQSLYNGMEKEVTSVHVGELVMDKLRALELIYKYLGMGEGAGAEEGVVIVDEVAGQPPARPGEP